MKTITLITGLMVALAIIGIGAALYVDIAMHEDPIEVTIEVKEKSGPYCYDHIKDWRYDVKYVITPSEDVRLECSPILVIDGKEYGMSDQVLYKKDKRMPIVYVYTLDGYDGHRPQSVEIIPASNWELNGLDVKLIT